MIGLLIDHNIELHGRLLCAQFSAVDWQAMQVSAALTLEQAGFDVDASDGEIWTYCQRQGLLLVTANRNKRGADSLQAVIDRSATDSSLPVLTLANPDRVLNDPVYRELCAYRIADIALGLSLYLGATRLYLP